MVHPQPYPSVKLYHGPGAKNRAHAEGAKLGTLLFSKGEEGLKVQEAREVVETLESPPPYADPPVIILGPMDHATHAASDALLKSIEEFDPQYVRPVLWAWDICNVIPTVSSRCVPEWCPTSDPDDQEVRTKAEMLVQFYLIQDRASIIETLRNSEWEPILLTLPSVLLEHMSSSKAMELWESLRRVLSLKETTKTEFLSALL